MAGLIHQPQHPPLECAICFDDVDRCAELPCACRVVYCMACWDRALAQSYNSCGQARCPTCRSPVRVDFLFDEPSQSYRLFFSRQLNECDEQNSQHVLDAAEGDADDEDGEVGTVWEERSSSRPSRSSQIQTTDRSLLARDRLIDQARPAQVRLLNQFNVKYPHLHNTPVADLSELIGRLVNEGQVSAPTCVCGCALELVTSHERACRTISRLAPQCPPGSAEFARLVELIGRTNPFISCDLCRSLVPPTDGVWTCANGNKTILHANAYDVCKSCFSQYAGGHPPQTVTPEPSGHPSITL